MFLNIYRMHEIYKKSTITKVLKFQQKYSFSFQASSFILSAVSNSCPTTEGHIQEKRKMYKIEKRNSSLLLLRNLGFENQLLHLLLDFVQVVTLPLRFLL